MNSFTPKGKSDVEIRAAQELKDARDFQYNTNQTLNSLKEGIISLSMQHEKVMAKCDSDRKALLIEFENLREWILASFKEMNKRLGDAESKLFEVLDAFTDLREEAGSCYLTREDFVESFDELEQKICSNHLKQTMKSDHLLGSFDQLKGQAKLDLENLRKELTPVPPEVDPVQAQIDERFAVFKIDFDGLVKEISLLKRAVFYDQKKFENVYTLIERLKEGKK